MAQVTCYFRTGCEGTRGASMYVEDYDSVQELVESCKYGFYRSASVAVGGQGEKCTTFANDFQQDQEVFLPTVAEDEPTCNAEIDLADEFAVEECTEIEFL